MSEAIVDYSKSVLDGCLRAEWRGNGDILPALRRIASRTHIPYAKLYALKYRERKDVDGSVLLNLHVYYEALCERQAERYRAARDATDTSHPIAGALSRLAAAIAGENDQSKEG